MRYPNAEQIKYNKWLEKMIYEKKICVACGCPFIPIKNYDKPIVKRSIDGESCVNCHEAFDS